VDNYIMMNAWSK